MSHCFSLLRMPAVKYGLLTLLALCYGVGLYGCAQEPAIKRVQGATMGTQYHVAWVGQQEIQEAQVQVAIDQRLHALNQKLSTYI